MRFLLSNCNELSFDGLVAVNGGYNNSNGYSPNCNLSIIIPPPPPPYPPTGGGYSTSCSGSGTLPPGVNSVTYTTAQESVKPMYIIDVNKLKKMYS